MTCRPYTSTSKDPKKRKIVTYFYVIDVAPKGAPRQQKQRRGFRSLKACNVARNKELTERHEGTYVDLSRESTRTYLDRWRTAVAHKWRPSTRAQVAETARVISTELGDLPLSQLDALTIQSAYAKLEGRLAPLTIRRHHTVFKQALKQAVRWKLLRDNPADGVSLPTADAAPVDAWSAQEQATFLNETRGELWHPLWVFLLDSGCRMGEALTLAWADINFETRYVSIRRTLTRDEHNQYIIGTDTKTAASRRSVQIFPETIAILKEHRRAQREMILQSGGLWHDRDLVFPGKFGDLANPGTLWGHLTRSCIAADVPPLSSHGLRKTMTTLWLEAGVAPSVVAARLGHKNVTMTLNVYTKVSRSWGEQGLNQVAAYLRSAQPEEDLSGETSLANYSAQTSVGLSQMSRMDGGLTTPVANPSAADSQPSGRRLLSVPRVSKS